MDYEISRERFQATKRDLLHEVKKAYFAALFYSRALAHLKDMRNVLNDILADRRSSFSEGMIIEQEVLEAEANLAANKSGIVEAEEGYVSALALLRFLAVMEETEVGLSTYFRTSLPAIDEDALNQTAVTGSPDLAVLRNQEEKTLLFRQMERAGSLFRPDISLNVTFEVAGQDIPFSGTGWTDTWDYNLVVTIGSTVNLFDSGQSRWKIKQAEEAIEMARLGVSQAAGSLTLQVRQRIEAVRKNYYSLRKQESRLTAVKEQYKNARVSYENELITREGERGARLLLLQDELNLLSALYLFEDALIELEYLTGVSIE